MNFLPPTPKGPPATGNLAPGHTSSPEQGDIRALPSEGLLLDPPLPYPILAREETSRTKDQSPPTFSNEHRQSSCASPQKSSCLVLPVKQAGAPDSEQPGLTHSLGGRGGLLRQSPEP